MKTEEKDAEMENKSNNNSNKLIKSKNTHSNLSKEEVVKTIKESMEGIEEVDDISDDEDYSLIYREKDGYGYFLSVEGDKKNYIKNEVSFGDIENLLSKKQFEDLNDKISEANQRIKCIKGYIYKSFSEKTNKDELNFCISYESFSFPSLTKSQLSQHLKTSRFLMDSYLNITLDAVYLE